MQILGLIFLGAVSGIISGLLGLGGAIIVIPVLVYFFGYSEIMAQGTSLAMLLPPIGLLATWRYWKDGNVNLLAAMILAVSFFLFSLWGADIAAKIPGGLLKRIFGVGLIAVGLFMIFEKTAR